MKVIAVKGFDKDLRAAESAPRNNLYILDMSPCAKLKRALSAFRRELEQQAAATARVAEQERYRAAYVKRHTPQEPNDAA